MAIKYHVRLDEDERAILKNLIKQEKTRVAQHKKRNAHVDTISRSTIYSELKKRN